MAWGSVLVMFLPMVVEHKVLDTVASANFDLLDKDMIDPNIECIKIDSKKVVVASRTDESEGFRRQASMHTGNRSMSTVYNSSAHLNCPFDAPSRI